jgi:hypothetical protein
MKGKKYNDIYTEKSYHLGSSRGYHALAGDNENNQRDDRLPCFDFAGICFGICTNACSFVHCVGEQMICTSSIQASLSANVD